MKIKNFEIVERCLFWREKKILVVGDLHLGFEDSLKDSGVVIPRGQMEETFEILKKIFKKTGKLKKIILLGDVKHHFKGILKQEREDFLNLVEYLEKHLLKGGKIIITKGNHDNILKPMVENYDNVKLKNYLIIDDVLFFHGDFFSLSCVNFHLFEKKIKTVVKGHFHPALVLADGLKKEKYKCFLYGKFVKHPRAYPQRAKNTIIVPSFFPLIEGSDVLNHWQLSKKDVLKCKIFGISGDDVFEFNARDLDE